jgi:hypothetical protein
MFIVFVYVFNRERVCGGDGDGVSEGRTSEIFLCIIRWLGLSLCMDC